MITYLPGAMATTHEYYSPDNTLSTVGSLHCLLSYCRSQGLLSQQGYKYILRHFRFMYEALHQEFCTCAGLPLPQAGQCFADGCNHLVMVNKFEAV